MNATDQRRHLAPVPTNTNTAEPPHDIAAEQIVIGAMLLSRDAVDDVTQLIHDPATFYRPAHQVIYETVVDMADRGCELSPVAVHAELAKQGERAITAVYLHECVAQVPVIANAGYYARIVAERAVLRRLVEAGTRIAQIGYSGTGEIDDLVDLARAEADRATEPTTTHTHTELTIGDRMPGYMDRLERGRDATNLIPVPYNTLRRLVPGFAPGQLIAVGGRPGTGKSVLAVDILRKVSVEGGMPSILFSMEMTADEVMDRIHAAEGDINLAKFTRGRLDDTDWDKFARTVGRVAEAPLVIDDSPNVSLAHIRSRLRAMSRRGPARIAVIDYLQLMDMPKEANREQEIAKTTRALKNMAREFELPIVVLAQVNRNVVHRTDKTPTLADFRESGAVEQDANIAILLHRPEIHDPEDRPGELDLIVAKNRSGPLGTETVQAQMHYSRCVDFADPRAIR